VDFKIGTLSLEKSPKETKYMQERIVGTKREERGPGTIPHAKAQKMKLVLLKEQKYTFITTVFTATRPPKSKRSLQ